MVEFDKGYWEHHWGPPAASGEFESGVNPYLAREIGHLRTGTALDAGCGTGAEAVWLSTHGWHVTGADISRSALTKARARAAESPVVGRIDWMETDLSRWEPEQNWDLVVTNYAHAEIGQLPLHQRISSWVAPGGTLLIVGHRHGERSGQNTHPEEASVTLETIAHLFEAPTWHIDAAYEDSRTAHAGDWPVQLHDVVVRARRIA